MWEYVKGSEQDFEGLWPEVTHLTTFEGEKFAVIDFDYMAQALRLRDLYEVRITNPTLHKVIAERRKVDNLQNRVNDANLTEALITERELTGSRVNYYLTQVVHPQREEQAPYQAECEDIIQSLNMTFDEGCLFKAIWRNAAARLNNGKPGQSAVYDAEKMMHYASRIHKMELSK